MLSSAQTVQTVPTVASTESIQVVSSSHLDTHRSDSQYSRMEARLPVLAMCIKSVLCNNSIGFWCELYLDNISL